MANLKQELPAYMAACSAIALDVSQNGGQVMNFSCHFGLLFVKL